ncbi:MAG: Hpt domain-containing protein [Lachnospiraceae bacterium]|nr:Hpt domain-containing protein [Lachnospiraceae bacterium]
MTVKECYEFLGADYDGVLGRLMKEERVTKYLGKFLQDPMLEPLEKALEEKDYETAFRCAHNIKGVCQNLGITVLADVSSDLTEKLRGGEPSEDITPELEQVRQEYAKTVEALETL